MTALSLSRTCCNLAENACCSLYHRLIQFASLLLRDNQCCAPVGLFSEDTMKASAFVLLFVFLYVECRKTYTPIDKNANIAFINMEGGGGVKPAVKPAVPAPGQAPVPAPAPTIKPNVAPQTPPTTPKPVAVAPTTPKATPTPVKPAQPVHTPTQIKPVPVNPAPVANPITTPGPGSVKQLINFYDAQGKGSPIRPYSYSQAVKQG